MQIQQVGFAAIKGTRHTSYGQVLLDARGPVGDRAFCLVDVDAARVLRTVQNPSLLAVSVESGESSLDVVLPGGEAARGVPAPTGERLACDYWGRTAELELLDGPHSDLFSSYLGRPVRLAAAPRGQVVYGASVTIVSTASMRELASRMGRPELAGQSARFRATVEVDGHVPHQEDEWVGREITLGDAVVRVRGRVPRCAVIDHEPATGVKDAAVLKTLASYRPRDAATGDLCFGVDAEVTVPGTIRPGDAVSPAGAPGA
ncbi:MOSC domain-containing protein [Nocardioides pacificus]